MNYLSKPSFINILYSSLEEMTEVNSYQYGELVGYILLEPKFLPFHLEEVSEAKEFIKQNIKDLHSSLSEINRILYEDEESKTITMKSSPVVIANHYFALQYGAFLAQEYSLPLQTLRKVIEYPTNDSTTKILLFLLKKRYPKILLFTN